MEWLFLAAALHPLLCSAHAKKLATIDMYCEQLKDEFRETVPVVFSGPDPWTQIEEVDAKASDTVLAYIYADGPAIRWVVLALAEPKGNWRETVNYFFRNDGRIAKRERFLQSFAANIELTQVSYYENGHVIKDHTQHHAIGQGSQDSSKLDDPSAPEYLNVEQLPFPEAPDYWHELVTVWRELSPYPKLELPRSFAWQCLESPQESSEFRRQPDYSIHRFFVS